ncbi:MAG: glycosyltransferase family 2 protein [Phycisphaerae bacterium]|jgi:glycosyltransferase involved in cell wall biosynthesis
MTPKISIIIATYNGGRYLSEQLESIFTQSYKDWQLFIRDDGSSDNTSDVIKEYAKKRPAAIKLITDADGNIGTSQNFLRILSHTDTGYVMFCDQDDIWLPDKIKITLDKIKETEKKYGINTPILIHTDLKVVDKDLNVIADSFWKYQRLNPEKGKTLNRLLVQNVITGSTVMMNSALKDKIKILPEQMLMHDWWIALAAAAFGKIDYVPIATALYRQHDNNITGAKAWDVHYVLKTLMFGMSRIKTALQKTQLQAKAFLDIYKDNMTDEYSNLLKVYSTLDRQNFFLKRLNVIKYRFFKIGLLRNLGLFWAI